MAVTSRIVLSLPMAIAIATSLATACTQVDFIRVMDDFDLEKFAGTWFEIYFKKPHFDRWETWHNVGEIFTPTEEGMLFSQVSGSSSQSSGCIQSNKTLTYSPSQPAKLTVPFYYNSSASIDADFWVIHTDYENLAVVYGCDELDDYGYCAEERSHGWVYSRQPQITSILNDTIMSHLNRAFCEDISEFTWINHDTECLTADTKNSANIGISLGLLTIVLPFLACLVQ